MPKAKKICESCPVQIECEKYSAATGSNWGVWAGEMKGK